MKYKGYKIRVRCINWEQEEYLGTFWNFVTQYIDKNSIIGLGMNWTEDYLYFDYALGVIDDETTLKRLKSIDFANTKFNPKYIEVDLPKIDEWITFKGKEEDLKQIYEKEIDCCNRKYDYELEYIDKNSNIEIKIHFMDI